MAGVSLQRDNVRMEKVRTNFKKPKPRYFFKEWRKYRGYTQEQLAGMIGSSTPTISQLENGKQGFTDSTLELLAEALSCSPGDLLMRNPLDKGAPWSILDTLATASPENRQAIADFADYILNKDKAAG